MTSRFLSVETNENVRSSPLGTSVHLPSSASSFDTPTINETPEPDSLYGDRESTVLSPVNTDIDTTFHSYHRDPGEVNVHQFYPILEHNFNRKQQQRNYDMSLLAIDEEDSRSDQSDEGVNNEFEKPKYDEQESSKKKLKTSEIEENTQRLATDSQEDVFTTAVDEETIQAAIERSKNVFLSDTIGNKIQKKDKFTNIITETAWQHYQSAINEKNDPHHCVMLLNKAILLIPNEHTFFAARAEAFMVLCDFKSAILNYKKACMLEERQEYYSRLAFLHYFQGQAYFDLGQYTEALESFSRATELAPNNVGYSIKSIVCLAALQRQNECLILVNKILDADHRNPDLFILRARLHEMFRNATQCYYDVKEALELAPEHSEGNAMMEKLMKLASSNKIQSMELNIAGRHREALQKMMLAIAINPSAADFYVLRGALYRKLSDFNSAIDDFLLAMEKCGHKEDDQVFKNAQRQLLVTYNDFAVECFQKGFYDEAVVLLNKAIKGDSNEKALYVNRGDCFYKQGNHIFALEDYSLALEIDPENIIIKSRIAAVQNDIGESLLEDKKYLEAVEKFTAAIENNPKNGTYYVSRAKVHLILKDLTGAKQDVLIGLLLEPDNEDVISIMTHLFPGKSIGDVTSSTDAQIALAKLSNIALATPPKEFLTQNTDNDMGTLKQGTDKNPKVKFAMCMEEREFYLQQVREKKKVEKKVKDALQNRKSLQYSGAKLQPLPPQQTKKKKSISTNWRTFTLGVGGI